jgi:hypothetical protein
MSDEQSQTNTAEGQSELTAVVMRGDGEMYFGKYCPKGMVQVEFVSCSPKNRVSDYGWKPEERAFIEVYVDGSRFRIEVGNFNDGQGKRRGLHIVHSMNVELEKTSLNACSLYFKDA